MKKYFLIILLFSLLFTIAIPFKVSSAENYPTIVKDYPELPACKDNAKCRPGKAGFGIPEYIKYIYIFSLGIVGVIGLLAIIIAAFQYVTSAGNPQQAANAKDKIISALLGMILLLGSYVLLKTINPDLLKLKAGEQPTEVELPGAEETGCRVVLVSWDRLSVDYGGKANLSFYLSGDCAEKSLGIVCNPPIAYQATKGCNFATDTSCANYWTTNQEMHRDELANTLTYVYYFQGGCALGDYIQNCEKDAPETIYIKGNCELKNTSDNTTIRKFYIPCIEFATSCSKIDVRDLKDDGTCCK